MCGCIVGLDLNCAPRCSLHIDPSRTFFSSRKEFVCAFKDAVCVTSAAMLWSEISKCIQPNSFCSRRFSPTAICVSYVSLNTDGWHPDFILHYMYFLNDFWIHVNFTKEFNFRLYFPIVSFCNSNSLQTKMIKYLKSLVTINGKKEYAAKVNGFTKDFKRRFYGLFRF